MDLLGEYSKLVPVRESPPTPKQMYVIRRIQHTLKVRFKGKTTYDASQFIATYAEESRRKEKDELESKSSVTGATCRHFPYKL